jgi:hypothetical protein
MKNFIKVALVAVGTFAFAGAHAQTDRDSTLGHKIGTTAKKVGHKTSQIAASGASAIAGKRYDDKYGPQGQLIYINKHDRCYYINKRGHRVYIKRSQLLDKKPE